MRYFIGITDDHWYSFLAARQPDEVNFWRPSGRGFGAVDVGEPFLFKLHSPQHFIVGGGFFVRCVQLPLSLAWEAFGEKNGAADRASFAQLVKKRHPTNAVDPDVGCIILNEPFFIPREHWIPVPSDWGKGIQQGKTYDTANAIGADLWQRVAPWLPSFGIEPAPEMPEAVAEQPGRFFGNEYLRRTRLGQGAFRALVTSAYSRRCAISGEKTLPVLQASHIKPFGQGPNRVDNGLLLRSDLHILFDRGYLTVTTKQCVEVSPRIREEFENGKDYYRYHGNPLAVVPRGIDQPNADFLSWHNENVFRA